MEHILKALNEHIAHQDWLLKCARREIDQLKEEVEKLRSPGEGAKEEAPRP